MFLTGCGARKRCGASACATRLQSSDQALEPAAALVLPTTWAKQPSCRRVKEPVCPGRKPAQRFRSTSRGQIGLLGRGLTLASTMTTRERIGQRDQYVVYERGTDRGSASGVLSQRSQPRIVVVRQQPSPARPAAASPPSIGSRPRLRLGERGLGHMSFDASHRSLCQSNCKAGIP